MTDRSQYVRVNGVKSSLQYVKCGIPQGAVLEPLLFIAYLNDIYKYIEDIILFADDTVLSCCAETWEKLEEKLNNKLKLIADWLSLNELSLNKDKTVYITFTNHNDKQPRDRSSIT